MGTRSGRPFTAVEFRTEPWNRRTPGAITTAPTISHVDAAASRVPGGLPVTVYGTNFRNSSDGSSPIVTFGGAPAAVTFVSSTFINCVVPPGLETVLAGATGYVDVVVQCDSQFATLVGGFLYYAGVIISIDPPYQSTAGGAAVIVKGAALVAGATFTFGGVAATGVTFIDDTHYSVRPPAHTFGYVDVVYTEPGGATSTIRHGFQYTTLTRGTDIRRYPGTVINKTLGGTPNTASFTIDGQSHKPVAGEEIHITDDFDGGRELFSGLILSSNQDYEGQTDQLVWACLASDFTYLMNKYRPFGSFVDVSASEVVRTLMGKYAPSFNLDFVQTKLAFITISFDGTKTMSEALDAIAQAIGGARWYLDGRSLHFFNPPPPTSIVVPPSTGTTSDFLTPPVISLGGLIPNNTGFPIGYYAVRVSFLYSNGVESRLGPTSNVVAFGDISSGHAQNYIHIASIPIGLDPSAEITCVGRKIYYLRGVDAMASGWTINDNTTTTIDVFPNMDAPPAGVTDDFGDPVTATDSGSEGTSTQSLSSQAEGNGFNVHQNVYITVAGSGDMASYGAPYPYVGSQVTLMMGGNPQSDNILVPVNFYQGGGFCINFQPAPGYYRFRCTAVYPGNVETLGTPPSGDVYCASYAVGGRNVRNYSCWCESPPVFPAIDGKKPIKFKVYAGPSKLFNFLGALVIPPGADPELVKFTAVATGSQLTPLSVLGSPAAADGIVYQYIGECPYFENTVVGTNRPADASGNALDTSNSAKIPATQLDFGQKPPINPASSEQTFTWPNPDGPYLEDFSSPHDIDDTDEDLLHQDTGSQSFRVVEDITQLRNRVKVFGASTTTTEDAPVGATEVGVADPGIFSVNGGQVLAANGVNLDFFSTSDAVPGTTQLLLRSPLTQAIPSGTVLQYYSIAEDIESQKARGKIELDALGNQTDGVHEYVVSDPSLASNQQVYLRAQAEIAVYSKPIIRIMYATRDPLSRTGARVNVDLTNPPCKGTFLIQSVTIDQIRDEGDQLAPRYTVTASSVFYDLTNFLLNLTKGASIGGGGSDTQSSSAPGGGGSAVGLVASATAQSSSSTAGLASFPLGLRGMVNYSACIATNGAWAAMIGSIGTSFSGTVTNPFVDSRGNWVRTVSAASNGSSAGFTQSGTFFRPEHGTVMQAYLRFGSNVRNVRMWFTAGSSAPTNVDSPALGNTCWGLRFSTVANDAGFRPFCNDGSALTIGDPIVAPVAGGEYLITIAITSSGLTCTIVDSSGNTSIGSLTVPPKLLGNNCNPGWLIFTQEAVSKEISFLHFGYQSGLN